MKMHLPILSTIEKAAQQGLKDSGRAVLERARDLSPTDTGASDKSGFVATEDLTVQVGFTSLVSLLQHENLDWKHPKGGEAKFLERALDEADIGAIVTLRVREASGG